MRMHLKRVPQNRALLNAQSIQFLPDYRGRAFFVRAFLDGKSVTHGGHARNLPLLQQEMFAGKRDPAVSTTAITRRFSAKNKLRIAVEMSCQSGQLCIWTIAWHVIGATIAPWVEQSPPSRRQCIGQKFGQFVIGHQIRSSVASLS